MRYKSRGAKEKPQRPPGSDRVSSPIVAPGHLEKVQAFLNTVGGGKAVDEIGTPQSLGDWLARQNLDSDEKALHQVVWNRMGASTSGSQYATMSRPPRWK